MLTNRQGHPVYDNQNQRTVGARGPATLENYQFLEKISHFDRERIPERVVHARGVTAFGYFEAYGQVGDEPIAEFTRAKLFQEPGKRTDVAVRFSTVIGGRDSSETARDPRGFAVKFYTEDGNWDLVGNNLGVFFIRDAIKFPDFIHSLKPDPVTFERQAPTGSSTSCRRRRRRCTCMLVCSARAASRRTTGTCRASASTRTSG